MGGTQQLASQPFSFATAPSSPYSLGMEGGRESTEDNATTETENLTEKQRI